MRRVRKRRIGGRDLVHSVFVGILITSILINFYFLFQNFSRNRVIRVVDGDSFDTKDGRRVRLLGVDAPEAENCMGAEARETLKILIEGRVVKLRDTVTDDYGRQLANIFSGSRFINKEIISRGLGKYSMGKNKYHEAMRRAYVAARENKLGIFSSLCRQEAGEEGCLVKANLRQGVKTYHLPGCRNYQQVIIDTSYGDKWFCSEEEAMAAGFRRAEGCDEPDM